eukprot:TRINITY_DN2429_c0_g1_i1.p1 TRINITY_DN2429_c0_g1~~TRINITY_DN2429_c0_g1_i1.p1  ORF type:complete len:175 (-),score=9.71 TRINITY_DN2429_c0_g1_i1:108-632(-)
MCVQMEAWKLVKAWILAALTLSLLNYSAISEGTEKAVIKIGGKLKENSVLSAAHGELAAKGFPPGLLPNSVANYTYNASSGDFKVRLKGRCDIILPPDNYPASFKSIIRGRLSKGRIQGLDGVSVRAFFKWWTITGIKSVGDHLVFEVGITSVKYPSANFGESPDCGGGKHSSS